LHEPGTVRGDPVAIREAVRNLVENAVKHTPAGTPIRVTVGSGCAITVEDGGPGLPSQSWSRLFEPFQRGSRSTEGVGLGLTIVQRAVDLHRGSIEVGRSRLGGAMFHMRFA
jgi:signal transduction histidine kinase